jgi:hypothetical protein
VFDLDEILIYLASIGEDNVAPQLRYRRTCGVDLADRDPDAGGKCFADDGLPGTIGERRVRTRLGVNGGW